MPENLHLAKLLWDHSGLWGLMTLESCRALGLPVEPVTAVEIKTGALAHCRLLVVPGGWPSLRRKALGDAGAEAIRRFVDGGGYYLGFCGGGGLALSENDGLGLIPLGRCRGKGRVQSASGPIRIRASREHPLWRGLGEEAIFHVWFPGQFSQDMPTEAQPVGVYQGAAKDLYCADVAVGSLAPDELIKKEKQYGIRLDPAVLWGRAAMIEAQYGRGKVMASYAHLDTTGDAAGGRAMQNLWQHWAGIEPVEPQVQDASPPHPVAQREAEQAWSLWEHGRKRGLWRPRHPQMPLWRRGARGLEFWTLLRLCRFAAQNSRPESASVDWPALVELLEPVWAGGDEVLDAQACRLAGIEPHQAGAAAESRWFPAARRMGAELLAAVKALENVALQLIRAA